MRLVRQVLSLRLQLPQRRQHLIAQPLPLLLRLFSFCRHRCRHRCLDVLPTRSGRRRCHAAAVSSAVAGTGSLGACCRRCC